MKAVLLNCTLKPSGDSSTALLLSQVAEELSAQGVSVGPPLRLATMDIKPGVSSDEGDGDQWPVVRQHILDSEILVIGTPIWMGQPSSVCKRVLERLDAFLGETDDAGRMVSLDRVAMVAVVGNEDGAHHVSAEVFQALNDVGFTIPAGAVTYWVGEAMGSTDYKDLPSTPAKTAETTRSAVRNTVHLARLLAGEGYPAGS